MPGDSYTRCYNKPPNRIPWYATDHNSIARIEFSFPFFVNCVIFSEVSKNCIKTVKSRINIPNCYTILSHIFSVKESIDRTSQYRLTLAHHLPFQTKSILYWPLQMLLSHFPQFYQKNIKKCPATRTRKTKNNGKTANECYSTNSILESPSP